MTGAPPPLGGPRRHSVDDLAHGDVDALGGERGHALVGDAAGHDVTEHRHVGIDVEREAVHGAAAGQLHPDGGHCKPQSISFSAQTIFLRHITIVQIQPADRMSSHQFHGRYFKSRVVSI